MLCNMKSELCDMGNSLCDIGPLYDMSVLCDMGHCNNKLIDYGCALMNPVKSKTLFSKTIDFV